MAGMSAGSAGKRRSMMFLPARPGTARADVLGWIGWPSGREQRDQAGGHLGGMRIGLMDLNRHAQVRADRWLRAAVLAALDERGSVRAATRCMATSPEKPGPVGHSTRVACCHHGMATTRRRGNGRKDSTRSPSPIGSTTTGYRCARGAYQGRPSVAEHLHSRRPRRPQPAASPRAGWRQWPTTRRR